MSTSPSEKMSEHQQKLQAMRKMQKSLDKLETASVHSERRADVSMGLPQDWLRHAHDRLVAYDEQKDELAYEGTTMNPMTGKRVPCMRIMISFHEGSLSSAFYEAIRSLAFMRHKPCNYESNEI